MNSLTNADTPEWREKIAVVVRELGAYSQVECPLKHLFAPGVYIREIWMPAGSIVIGKIHKTEHFNIVQKGRVSVFSPNCRREMIEGPVTFLSAPGIQKVLYIHEDTVWSTVHVTEDRDLERLEAALIESANYPCFDRELERRAIELAAREESSRYLKVKS